MKSRTFSTVSPTVNPSLSLPSKKTRNPFKHTPLENYEDAPYRCWVKREDLCAPISASPFSKIRGVFRHIASRPEEYIGVLDTVHSRAGWAVAWCCNKLGKKCVNYYPHTVHDGDFPYLLGMDGPRDHNPDYEELSTFPNAYLRQSQARAFNMGAFVIPLKAGMSAVLYHQAKKNLRETFGPDVYLMPNALKLEETVEETAAEVRWMLNNCPVGKNIDWDVVIVPVSSGTIAAGVIRGFWQQTNRNLPKFILHLGYTRSEVAVMNYLEEKIFPEESVREAVRPALVKACTVIDEKYSYAQACNIEVPWPCSKWYDKKALNWWLNNQHTYDKANVLFWNVG